MVVTCRYNHDLKSRRIETINHLTRRVTVPREIDSKHRVVKELLDEGAFLNPMHLFSSALYSFERNNGSYHLGLPLIPTRESPEGIRVPCGDFDYLVHSVKLGRRGSFEQLLEFFRGKMRSKLNAYYAPPGYSHEDLIAVGEHSLFETALCYQFGCGSFQALFYTVLKREIVDLIKLANREKHNLFNRALSLEDRLSDSEGQSHATYGDFIADPGMTPEAIYLIHKASEDLLSRSDYNLSEMEHSILSAYLGGLSYREIAEQEGYDIKQVDNALQRATKKTRRADQQQSF